MYKNSWMTSWKPELHFWGSKNGMHILLSVAPTMATVSTGMGPTVVSIANSSGQFPHILRPQSLGEVELTKWYPVCVGPPHILLCQPVLWHHLLGSCVASEMAGIGSVVCPPLPCLRGEEDVLLSRGIHLCIVHS